jgi:cytochrome c553
MRANRMTLNGGKALAVCVSLSALLGQGQAVAGDVKAGRAKADVCAVCHGLDGLSKIAEAPNIAGQNEHYLIEQLGAFQSGARSNDMMSVVVKDLSEDDIENLAAYYSAIPITVGKPPGD